MSVEKRLNVLKEFKTLIIGRDTIEAAMIISAYLHQGVKDKGGVPYICHPTWIANKLMNEGFGIEYVITAYLHDVYEDTVVTLTELNEWFNNRIVDAVDALSKRDNESVQEYISRVAMNPIAREVKIRDLKHNTDITRLKNRKNLTEKDLNRLKIYAEEYDYLVGGRVGV